MLTPLVTVVMPVYNAEAYVSTAARSILQQSFHDFEFLIFDDGSSDRSLRTLQALAIKDHRIRLFQEGHRGYVPWLNEGMVRARGKFIARMDADDVALPERFSCQAAFLEEHPECVAVGSDCMLIDPDGSPIRRLRQPASHEAIDAWHLSGRGGGLAHPSVMMRTASLRAVGGYREEFQYSEDLDLWLRLAEVGRLANLSEILLKYRQHFKSVSHLHRQRQLELLAAILRQAHHRRGLPPQYSKDLPTPIAFSALEMQQYWAEIASREGHFTTARKHFYRVLQAKPREFHLWLHLLDTMVPPCGSLLRDAWHGLRGRLITAEKQQSKASDSAIQQAA